MMSQQPHSIPSDSRLWPPHTAEIDNSFWVIDRRLPLWARRTNPIVRRHLGGFLSAPLPELDILTRLLLVQIGIIALSLLIPALLEFIALIGLVSFFILPPTFFMYGRALVAIGRDASNAIIDERQSQALETLRTTPLTLRSILLSKIAFGIWRQALNMDTAILAAALLSLPPVTIQVASAYPPSEFVGSSHLMIIIGLLVSVLRIVVEPFMVGALGILSGTFADHRITAITWTPLLTIAYFVMINLPRLMTMTWLQRLLLESVLPMVLPLLIGLGALAISEWRLKSE